MSDLPPSGHLPLRLMPWSNGYLRRSDPAEEVRNCPGCGEDYGPGERHSCERQAS